LNQDNLKLILDEVKSIAIVGVSPNPERDSYKVMKFLQDNGFKVFPVNPKLVNSKILDQECYSSLDAIEEKVDMVNVFRATEHIPSIANEAIKIKAKILWTQEGLYSEEAKYLGENAGLKVVMDQCPKKILKN
jgi:predicted CoA-binding protein|tara:strand:- start:201 stop:599 length:399 start_codon:yes stop_codon:yes gene_type:complete